MPDALAAPTDEWSLVVLPHRGGRTDTRSTPSLDGVQVDLGSVSTYGPPPRNGRRVVGADGTAYFIASVELEARRLLAMETPRSRTHAKAPDDDELGARVTRFEDLPAPGRNRVDLYASASSGAVVEVRIAPAGSVDWSAGGGVALGPTPIPLAQGITAGETLRFEIALVATPYESGWRSTDIRFELR